VIFSYQSTPPNLHRSLVRRARKIVRIGPLGALNGLRLRAWFTHFDAGDIVETARQLGVVLHEVSWMNSSKVATILASLEVDLAISLGNGYLGTRVFEIPRLGMINYHGELLPEYPGAQSIIWPIYDGRITTGFTIHRINATIDGGDILYRREFPIQFRSTLRKTVEATQRTIHPHLPAAVRYVCENFDALAASAIKQNIIRSYTTPTFGQFVRMARNNQRFYRQFRGGSADQPAAKCLR
jgi:methionyl-tRNA formyltransferase